MFRKTISLIAAFMFCLLPLLAVKTPLPGPNQTLSADYRLTPVNPAVKILIAKEINSADLVVEGPYRVFNPETELISSYGLFGKNYQIEVGDDGIKWGEEFPGIFQIAIVPANARTKISVNNIAYPGSIFAYQVNGKIYLINQVKVEDYLKSILTTEIGSELNDEALAAAAIVARTDAYYHTLRYPKAYYHYEAKDIGYLGQNCIRDRNIENAVDATKYLVMKQTDINAYQGLFPATWTAHSAGKTVLASIMFRKPDIGAFSSVTSQIAQNDREKSSWSLILKRSEFAKAIGLQEVSAVSLYTDHDSGKVYGLKAQNDLNTKDVDFISLQKALGKDRLKSSDFSVNVKDDLICFEGVGKGHGVGLCLFSANKLAESGVDAVNVLQKYFPGTDIVMMPTLEPLTKPIY